MALLSLHVQLHDRYHRHNKRTNFW